MKAIADIEKAILDALEKQYADVLSPLKENLTPKKFGFKYVQKLTKRSVCPYVVPEDVSSMLICPSSHLYFVFLGLKRVRSFSWGFF